MELTALYRCFIALDVHQAKLRVCIMYENEPGEVLSETQELCGFKKDRIAIVAWVASFKPELVVMESTGIYFIFC
jgi:transposase